MINIVDAGCGVGKTTAMINKINADNNDSHKYLYITPLLTETQRIQKECKDKHFRAPEERNTKMEDIIRLFEKGYNIVSTHALFRKFNEQILDIAKLYDYILIMDEVADVVDELQISRDDMSVILKEYVELDEKNVLNWTATEYEGKFEEYRDMIYMGGVVAHTSNKNEPISLMWMFPIKIFEAFKEIYVITYMFNGQFQQGYYKYFGMKFKQWYVVQAENREDYKLTLEEQKYDYSKIKGLANVCTDKKLNKIGDGNSALSLSWFERNKDSELMNTLKRNIYNFYRHKANVPANKRLWTTFKEYENKLSAKGFSNCFAPLNMRATNDYRERTAIVYACNRFLRPTMKNFFTAHNIPVDEDAYALSELIQFVFRGAIRDGNPIDVYIPSERMRKLFTKWIEKKDL